MSRSAPTGAPQVDSTDLRSGKAFKAACDRRDFVSLQEALRVMPKREAVDHLCWLFPDKAREWLRRKFPYLMAMDPDTFWRLAYSDPTGEAAARNVDDDRVAA